MVSDILEGKCYRILWFQSSRPNRQKFQLLILNRVSNTGHLSLSPYPWLISRSGTKKKEEYRYFNYYPLYINYLIIHHTHSFIQVLGKLNFIPNIRTIVYVIDLTGASLSVWLKHFVLGKMKHFTEAWWFNVYSKVFQAASKCNEIADRNCNSLKGENCIRTILIPTVNLECVRKYNIIFSPLACI